jgi:hypothetical protein
MRWFRSGNVSCPNCRDEGTSDWARVDFSYRISALRSSKKRGNRFPAHVNLLLKNYDISIKKLSETRKKIKLLRVDNSALLNDMTRAETYARYYANKKRMIKSSFSYILGTTSIAYIRRYSRRVQMHEVVRLLKEYDSSNLRMNETKKKILVIRHDNPELFKKARRFATNERYWFNKKERLRSSLGHVVGTSPLLVCVG